MICELCGKGSNACKRVRIEGSIVVACASCCTLGEVVGPAVAPVKKPVVKKVVETPKQDFKPEIEFELVEGYGKRIKDAREKKGLKQEDLGRMISEPASFIHHLELGHAEPSDEVAKKLQAKLGIQLLVRHVEDDSAVKSAHSGALTLGDVVVVKSKERK